MIGVIVRSAGV